MHTLFVIYGRPQDEAAFRAHYETVHLPLVAQLPGLRSARHTYDVSGQGEGDTAFCVFQGLFDSRAALEAALSSDIGAKLAADAPNYATGGIRLLMFPTLD